MIWWLWVPRLGLCESQTAHIANAEHCPLVASYRGGLHLPEEICGGQHQRRRSFEFLRTLLLVALLSTLVLKAVVAIDVLARFMEMAHSAMFH